MTPSAVIDLMDAFAERTGSSSGAEPRRYLWTDAFAVINFLKLHRRTKDGRYRTLAVELIEQVHTVLGRHRADDARIGWLSGLTEDVGGAQIVEFWSEHRHRQSPTWQDHRDINEVMLATALLKAQVGTAVINQAADEG